MILFIASEVMFFVAWFWAYFNASLFPSAAATVGGVWPPKGIEVLDPFAFPLLNTMILLLSGTTVTWAHHALIHGDRDGLQEGPVVHRSCSASCFSSIQAYEYSHAAFGFAGQHLRRDLLHGDRVPRLPRLRRHDLPDRLPRPRLRGDFTPTHHFGFEAAAWYWHFVDVVWLFLFIAIYCWGSHFGALVTAAAG